MKGYLVTFDGEPIVEQINRSNDRFWLVFAYRSGAEAVIKRARNQEGWPDEVNAERAARYAIVELDWPLAVREPR